MQKKLLLVCITLFFCTSIYAQSPESILARARDYRDNNVLIEAATIYEEYLKLQPNDHEVRIEYAKVLLAIRKRDAVFEQVRILRNALPKDPRVWELQNQAENLQPLATEKRRQEEQAQWRPPVVSEQNLKSNATKSGAAPEDILKYARYLQSKRRVDECVVQYRRYLQLRPTDKAVHLELAKVFGWFQRYPESEKELNALIAKEPQYADAYLFYGDILYWQGKEEQALETYKKVLNFSPNHKVANEKIQKLENSPSFRESQLLAQLKKNPNGPAADQLVKLYFEVGRYFEADSLNRLRLVANPRDSVLLAMQAKIREKSNEQLNKEYEEHRKRYLHNPNDMVAFDWMLKKHLDRFEYEPALQLLDKHLMRNPNDLERRLKRAQLLNWMKRSEEAVGEFRWLQSHGYETREVLIGLGNALRFTNTSLDEAEQIFQNDLVSYPDDLNTKIALADIMRREGKLEEAQALLKEVLAVDYKNFDATETLMLVESQLGPPIRRLERRINRNPQDWEARKELVDYYLDMELYYTAKEVLEPVAAQFPKDTAVTRKMNLINQQIAKLREEEIRQARFRIEDNPMDIQARIRYGQLLSSVGKYKEAVAQYRDALRLQPNEPEVMYYLAEALVASNQYKEAQEYYRQLADRYPANFQYRFRYAQLLSWSGDYDQALREYERANRINPNSAEVELGIANILRWRGQRTAAIQRYQRVLAIRPLDTEAITALRGISKVMVGGASGNTRFVMDSEDFQLMDYGGLGYIQLSPYAQMRAGGGTIEMSQHTAKEKGWYLGGGMDLELDDYTAFDFSGRWYQFEKRDSWEARAVLTHRFDKVPSLYGLETSIYADFRAAPFEILATDYLETWTKKLRTERYGIYATYLYQNRYRIEGEASNLMVSDGNQIHSYSAEPSLLITPKFAVGARIEYLDATKMKTEYWTPNDYGSAGLWFSTLFGSNRFNTRIRLGSGRIFKFNHLINSGSAELNWVISNRFTLNLSYSASKTRREDGGYSYHGGNGALYLNF
ncbi:MAG: tetratricopeptide repeat protein [bacterium]|nr:tetratricopeptide repeat protein [bacterium]